MKLVHVWTRAAPMLHFLTSGGGEGAAGHDDVNAWAFLLKKKSKKNQKQAVSHVKGNKMLISTQIYITLKYSKNKNV